MLAAGTVGLSVPVAADASKSMMIGVGDEPALNGMAARSASAVTSEWKSAGVQTVRTYAQWNHVAPNGASQTMPAGDLASQSFYDFSGPDYRLNQIESQGLSTTLVITGPGPVWASKTPSRGNGAYRPRADLFGKFVEAVVKRYGSRVDKYIIWNEPNVATWLQPQYSCSSSCKSVAPDIYRELARVGYSTVKANDPTAKVAIGTTSPKGDPKAYSSNATTPPLDFLRRMGCVNKSYARVKDGGCASFKPVTGDVLAYHPHSSKYAPSYKSANPSDARMGDISRLTTTIDKLTKLGRVKVNGASRFPLWFDEYAYETNPPDKLLGISLSNQLAWAQWGWWIASRNPRVQMLAHYEWFDELLKDNGASQFAAWQSGLYKVDGSAKPLAQAFPNPIFGYQKSTGAKVWGQVRPGNAALTVTLQRRSGTSWKTVKTATTDSYGNFAITVPKSSTAKYRYTYTDPLSGTLRTSATTGLRVL